MCTSSALGDLCASLATGVHGVCVCVCLCCRELLTKELEAVGIRLNRRKPNIYFKVCIQCLRSGLSWSTDAFVT